MLPWNWRHTLASTCQHTKPFPCFGHDGSYDCRSVVDGRGDQMDDITFPAGAVFSLNGDVSITIAWTHFSPMLFLSYVFPLSYLSGASDKQIKLGQTGPVSCSYPPCFVALCSHDSKCRSSRRCAAHDHRARRKRVELIKGRCCTSQPLIVSIRGRMRE